MLALDCPFFEEKIGSVNISKPLASTVTITTLHVKLLLQITPRYFIQE